MKHAARIAWSFVGTTLLAVLFLLFTAAPARAPHGGKKFLGGRTIAAIQEEDFDRKILRYQLCYGIRLHAESATKERRRVCKALLIHRLDAAFAPQGTYLREPVEFHCEDTAFGRRKPASKSLESVALKPNAEFRAIDALLERKLESVAVSDREDHFAREACSFLTDCKMAMRPNQIALRKLASCFTTPDLVHRRILLDEIGAMLFRAKGGRSKILYAELLEEARR